MKLIIGFLTGLVAGAFLFDNMTPEQRSNVTAKASDAASKVKSSKVGNTVKDNAADVAETAGDRAKEAVDAAGQKANDAIKSDDDPKITV